MKYVLLSVMICCLVTSCAELQVKRDLAHAQNAQNYRAATSSGEKFEPSALCTAAPPLKSWVAFEFTPSTTIYSLPNDSNAAASCIAIPAGASAMEIHGGSKGGMTYHEATAIHPSVIFVDQNYEIIRDLQKPRLKAGEGYFSGLGVSAIIPLLEDLAAARYAVIYIHPLSTSGEIDVYTGYQTIPVPYGPYGTVKARFFD
jgi:hypothetical protein